MTHKRDNILDQARAQGLATPSAGMKVPEGYFAAFTDDLMSRLPERPELSQEAAAQSPRTFWERVRPYVYMAAMFAGIWLMLQMFTSFDHTKPMMNVDENPVLAEALAGEDFIFDYVYPNIDSSDLVDDLLDSDELDADFRIEDLFGEEPEISDQTYILP